MTRAHYELCHDEYGRPHLLADIAVPRGRDPYWRGSASEPYLVKVTERSYATHPGSQTRYLLDRVASEVSYDVTAQVTGTLPELVTRLETRQGMPRRIIAATATYYDGPAFQGQPLGELGKYGLATRIERLAHTTETLAAAFGEQSISPWLADPPASETDPWPGYPEQFRAQVIRGGRAGGYVQRVGAGVPNGLYIIEAARRYDIHDTNDNGDDSVHGLLVGSRDACGVSTRVELDPYLLLPAKVILGDILEEFAEYDYRTQHPVHVLDNNDYHSRYTYTPLGLLRTVVRTGPDTDGVNPIGDTDAQPGILYMYGLTEYDDNAASPMWVHKRTRVVNRWDTLRRERERFVHAGNAAPSEAEVFSADEVKVHPERFSEQRDYSDGFERLLQSRTRRSTPVVLDLGLPPDIGAKPVNPTLSPPSDPQRPVVRVTKWAGYDNKGRVVEDYEPFFEEGWAYQRPSESEFHGKLQCIITHRDPRGVPIIITYPDRTERWFVHGRPEALNNPGRYVPNPWESYEYDADDNAARTHPDANSSWLANADTPANVEVDPLGRVIVVTERDGIATYNTRVQWDISGNVIRVIDAMNRVCYQASYDLLGRPWRETTLDGGDTLTVRDPLGAPVEQRDGRGAVTLTSYDLLHRFSYQWGCAASNSALTLCQAIIYGDDQQVPPDAKLRNLRGRPWRTYDQVGVTSYEQYDVHNNAAISTRRWLPVPQLAQTVEEKPPHPAWPPAKPGDAQLEAQVLGQRWLTVHAQRDRNGACHTVTISSPDISDRRFEFSRDSNGEVTAITVREGTYAHPLLLSRLVDAHGQQVLLERENHIVTRYLRDPRNTMLLRQYTEQADGKGTLVLHDSQLEHGPTGVVMKLRESRGGGQVITNTFHHDALDRLQTATGTMCPTLGSEPWDITPGTTDPQSRCSYEYDAVGNLLRYQREVADRCIEQRTVEFQQGTNRIVALNVKENGKKYRIQYSTDSAGQVTREGPSRTFAWDHAHRLHGISVHGESGQKATNYWYDHTDRVCSISSCTGKPTRLRLIIDGWITVNLTNNGYSGSINDITITVSSDGSTTGEPLAWYKITPDKDSGECWHLLSDYLGSIRAVIRCDGTMIETSDYSHYGQIQYRHGLDRATNFPRLLGYAKGEEDAAAGFLILGSRAYAPWLGRFFASETLDDLRDLATKSLLGISDPADPPTHRIPAWAVSPYSYAANSPLTVVDIQGRQSGKSESCQLRQFEPNPSSHQGSYLQGAAKDYLKGQAREIAKAEARELPKAMKDPEKFKENKLKDFVKDRSAAKEYKSLQKEAEKSKQPVGNLWSAIGKLWEQAAAALGGKEKPDSKGKEKPHEKGKEPEKGKEKGPEKKPPPPPPPPSTDTNKK